MNGSTSASSSCSRRACSEGNAESTFDTSGFTKAEPCNRSLFSFAGLTGARIVARQSGTSVSGRWRLATNRVAFWPGRPSSPYRQVRSASLVLDFINTMTYYSHFVHDRLSSSRFSGGRNRAEKEPIPNRARFERKAQAQSSRATIYVTVSRCSPRQDRPLRRGGLAQ